MLWGESSRNEAFGKFQRRVDDSVRGQPSKSRWTAPSSMESADIYKPDAQASGFGASYSLACASGLYGRKPGAVQLVVGKLGDLRDQVINTITVAFVHPTQLSSVFFSCHLNHIL